MGSRGVPERRCGGVVFAAVVAVLLGSLRADASVESDKSVPERMTFSLVPGDAKKRDIWWTVSDVSDFNPPCSQFSASFGPVSKGIFNLTEQAECVGVTNLSATAKTEALYTYMVRARLEFAQPNTSYALYTSGFKRDQVFYRRGAISATHFLRSYPAGSAWAPRVVFFGDLGVRGHVMPVVQMLASAGRADAVFHGGERPAHTFTHAPYMAAPGSPQGAWSETGEKSREGLLGGDLWWSVDVGALHVVAVDTKVWKAGGERLEKAAQWLRQDLQKANEKRAEIPWIVFFGRGSPFQGESNLLTEGGGQALGSLLQAFKVDLCVWGGGLNSYPADYARGTDGLLHVSLGVGDSKMNTKGVSGAEKTTPERGFGVLTVVSAQKLTWSYRACGWNACDARLLDSHVITRSGGSADPLPPVFSGSDEDVYAALPKEIPSGEPEDLKNKIEGLLTERQDLIWENRRLARQLRQLGKKVKVPRDRRPGTTWDTPGWDSPDKGASQGKVEIAVIDTKPGTGIAGMDDGTEDGEEGGQDAEIYTGPPVKGAQPQQGQAVQQPQKQPEQPSGASTPATPAPPRPGGHEGTAAITPDAEVLTKADLLWGSAGVAVIVGFFGFAVIRQRRR
eukprot:Hpha_TRINITY_DN27381_c0_g1::TRINITY_DN27381_c0_g1_i1::g.642::m.642